MELAGKKKQGTEGKTKAEPKPAPAPTARRSGAALDEREAAPAGPSFFHNHPWMRAARQEEARSSDRREEEARGSTGHEEAQARAEATALAPRLGLTPGQVDLRIDEDAGRRVGSRGRGVMDSGTVYLRPGVYEPGTAEGRYLLGHELAHVAQLQRATGGPPAGGNRAAEIEARGIGEAYARCASFDVPRAALGHTPAFDKDAEPTTDAPREKEKWFKLWLDSEEFYLGFKPIGGNTEGLQDIDVVMMPVDRERAYSWSDGEMVKAKTHTRRISVERSHMFAPKLIGVFPEVTAAVYTFDLTGDEKPDFSVRVDREIAMNARRFVLRTYDNKTSEDFTYSIVTEHDESHKPGPPTEAHFLLSTGAADDFVVSFDILPGKDLEAEVRVVIQPTNWSRVYQTQIKYWDYKGREVGKDDAWTSMGGWGVPAAPFEKKFKIADRNKFDAIQLGHYPEAAANVWTFDLDGDGKPNYGIRIEHETDKIFRTYNFVTSDTRNIRRFDYHYVQDDAWKHGYTGNIAPRRREDDFIDFLGDILTSKHTWHFAITMIPVVGEIVLAGEALAGYTIFGDKLSTGERVVSGLAALLPVAGALVAKAAGREAVTLARLAATMGRSEAEAMALLRAAEKQAGQAGRVQRLRATLKAGGELTAGEVAFLQQVIRQIEADRRVFRAVEKAIGAEETLRRGGKVATETGPISLKRLRTTLGRAGESPSGYRLRAATREDMEALRASGQNPENVYAWVSRDGAGEIVRDTRGRPVITFTPKGLSSLEEAVKSYGHEVRHIQDFIIGRGTNESVAEEAGKELWELVKRSLGK